MDSDVALQLKYFWLLQRFLTCQDVRLHLQYTWLLGQNTVGLQHKHNHSLRLTFSFFQRQMFALTYLTFSPLSLQAGGLMDFFDLFQAMIGWQYDIVLQCTHPSWENSNSNQGRDHWDHVWQNLNSTQAQAPQNTEQRKSRMNYQSAAPINEENNSWLTTAGQHCWIQECSRPIQLSRP